MKSTFQKNQDEFFNALKKFVEKSKCIIENQFLALQLDGTERYKRRIWKMLGNFNKRTLKDQLRFMSNGSSKRQVQKTTFH